MRDTLNEILEDGDLIVDIDHNYDWRQVGVIAGGETPSGRLRYLTPGGGKANAKPSAVVKISERQARNYFESNPETFNEEIVGMLFELQNKIKGI